MRKQNKKSRLQSSRTLNCGVFFLLKTKKYCRLEKNIFGGDGLNKKIPAISIVTPMYNAENFIADCLDSVLAQTFQDYEMIIVDDCSTDNSCAIVESYMPKFGGKLHLFNSEKNSQSPSVPRNTGINLSRGEYICFLDSDDGLLPAALEEIHYLTEEFKADVIHCEKYYTTINEEFTTDKKFLQIMTWELPPYVDSPTFLSNDLAQRMDDFFKTKICPFTWCKIVRRDFIIQNDITFPPMRVSGDYPYTFHIVCKAKTFLRVPNKFHVYRTRDDSQSRIDMSNADFWIHSQVYSILYGLAYFNKLIDKIEIFKTNKKLKYYVLNRSFGRMIYITLQNYLKFPMEKLIPLIKNELDKVDLPNELAAFFFARMNIFYAMLDNSDKYLRETSECISKQTNAIRQQMETIQTQTARIKQLELQIEELKKG